VAAENKNVGFVPFNGGSSSPMLKAYLNGGFLLSKDLGIDLRVVSVTADPSNPFIKFQWKTNTQKVRFDLGARARRTPLSHLSPTLSQSFFPEVTATYDATSPTYTSRTSAFHVQTTDGPTGLFLYFDVTPSSITSVAAGDSYFLNVTGNYGMQFHSADANTAHQFLECSGRGLCDRVAGSCACVAGYTGDACQRTSCPNDCSGNGICQSEAYFIGDVATATADASYSYSGFDANSAYGCKCDVGFRGADCSQRECPSGSDPMKGDGGADGMDCSGRGLCDYTKGACQCFKGFFGERCEELSTLV
jgi:hypothetical protein